MKKSYKTHFRAAFLVVLCLLFVTSVSAALSGFTNIGNFTFSNKTRTNELQFINLSNYNLLCAKANLSDLRFTEYNGTTETNLSYEFIGINHTQKNGYTTPGNAILIVSNTSNNISMYCNNDNVVNVNTTIISAYDYFKYTVYQNTTGSSIASFLLWGYGDSARKFNNSVNFSNTGDRASLGITRYAQYNPQIVYNYWNVGSGNYTSRLNTSLPIYISAKMYRSITTTPTKLNGLGLIVSNVSTATEHASDVGIMMSNLYNVTYDCSNNTETYTNTTIAIIDNVTHTAAMRIYSNYTELYWDNILVTNCTTNPVTLGALKQVRLTGGVLNSNSILETDGLYVGEFKIGNTLFNPYNSEYNLIPTSSLFTITYLDEISGNIINTTTITTNLYTNESSTTYTTNNGILSFGAIPLGVKNIRSVASGYNTRFSIYNLTNESSSIFVYLLNSSGTNVADVTINVIDNSGSPVYNAYVGILKYNYSTGGYDTITTLSTGSFGSVVDSFVYGTEFYRIYIYYPYGVLKYATAPSLMYNNELTFKIDVGEGLIYLYDIVSGITYDHYVYNNNSCYLELLVVPSTITAIKHDIYRTYNGYEILEDTDTITSPTSSWSNIYNFSTNNDTTIRCVFTAYVDDDKSTVSILNYQNSKSKPFGSLGMFFLILITLVVLFIGYFSLNLAIILAPLPLLVFSAIGIVDISTPICIVMEIAAIIVASMVRD